MKEKIDIQIDIINKKLEKLGLDWSDMPKDVMHKIMYIKLGCERQMPMSLWQVSIDDYIDMLHYLECIDPEGGISFRAFFES